MKFYQKILDSTPLESFDNLQSMNYPNNDQNENSSLVLNDQLWNERSQHCKLSHQRKFCSICELTKMIFSMYPSLTNTPIESHCLITPSADSIRAHVHLISPVFNIGEQEDVSEFIITLFDHFICCLPSHLSISSTLSLESTIIDQIFNIKLLSSGQCPSCLYSFKKKETTNMLIIEINNLNNLTDALAHFFDREEVSSFTCSNCCKCVKLDKRITINELSPILIINFKRCRVSFDSTEKLSHQVNYNELLDVFPYMTSYSVASSDKTENIDSSNNFFYKLYAIINHIGDDLNSGHYYCYVRSVDNLWFLVDDVHCRTVSSAEVLNHPQALMLFYETCKKLASVAAGVSINETYEDTLKQRHFFRLRQNELLKMNKYRHEKLEKVSNRKLQLMGLAIDSCSFGKKQSKNGKMSTTNNNVNFDESYEEYNDVKKKSKVNIEYLNLLLPHLKHYNSVCALCIRSRYFGKNVSKPNSLLVRCILQCSGSTCKFKCTVNVLNNGDCFVIAINQNIFHHVGERLSRPIRGSQRQALIEKFKSGASVYRLHAQYDRERTKNEKKGFNYDRTGKSKKIFKKIKAEAIAESLLSPDITLGILQLHDKLIDEINSDGIVKGALQVVQLRPFCIVAFTEASIRLYDAIVSHPETVLSWDATGGIIKNAASTSRQCLYYELTVSHPNITNEDSLVPLTFMLSESQTLHTVTNWLTAFKGSYKKIFPHKKDSFPRPAVILSDRAQILLQAALGFFNDENYQQFLTRAYRIVTHQAIKNDLSKTIIHACLSHFML
ncbi:unnamed protein product, partial [Rotaria sp. Silwood1]